MQTSTRPAREVLLDRLVLAIFQLCLHPAAIIPPPPGDENPHHLGIPWSHLSTLDFESTPLSPEIFLSIMQLSRSSLIKGRFRIESAGQPTSQRKGYPAFRSQELPPFKPVTANALQDLHLIVIEPSRDRRLFDALHLPALAFLSIEVDDTEDLDLYVPLLKKTPSLEYFSVDCYRPHFQNQGASNAALLPHNIIPNEIMERFLSALPTTQSLRLGLGLNMDSPTLNKLACGEILPELVALECSSVDGLGILSMVSRRNDATANIPQQSSIAPSSHHQYQSSTTHKSISLLHLLVPEDDLNGLLAEAKTIIQCLRATDIGILIAGMDSHLFY